MIYRINIRKPALVWRKGLGEKAVNIKEKEI